MANEYFKAVKNTERLTEANNHALKGIQFTNSVNAVANTFTAYQTFKQSQLQTQQMELQQVMAEQQTLHQFAMWRQTDEGKHYLSWQRQAADLVAVLKYRQAVWADAWRKSVLEAKNAIPIEETSSYRNRPSKLKRNGLKITGVVLLSIAAGLALLLIPAAFLAVNNLPTGGNVPSLPQQVLVFGFISLPYLLPAATGVTLLGIRHFLKRAAEADTTTEVQAHQRTQQWGYDPVTVADSYMPTSWTDEADVEDYINTLEYYIHDGYRSYPSPEVLPALVVPAAKPPLLNTPQLVEEAATHFQQQDEAFEANQ